MGISRPDQISDAEWIWWLSLFLALLVGITVTMGAAAAVALTAIYH
jgi:hypothetical protein